MKKVFFLSIISLFAFTSAFSQKCTLEGYIASGEEKVGYSTAVLAGTDLGGIADSSGHFVLRQIDPGEYTLKVSAIGYEDLTRRIKLDSGRSVTLLLEMKPSDKELEEVVVTGTMKEVSRSGSPIPVEVYSQTYFKKNPTPSLFESLQMVNGVQPQLNCNVCNTGDIHINGMEGPYTMVTIDGMPIVSSLSTVYGLSGIPNSMVKRIEVVKGPASTLYGSEAVGGLINVITKDASTAPRASLDVFSTSHLEYNTDLAFRQNIGKHSGLLGISHYYFNSKRDVNGDNFTDIPLQHRISVFNKWNFSRKYKRLASIAARYVYEDRWGGELEWNRSFRGGDSIYGESVYTRRYELIGNYQLPMNKEKVFLQYSFNTHHQNSAYGKVLYIATQTVAFAQLLYDKTIGKNNDLLIGLPFRYTWYNDNTPATQSADSLHPEDLPQKIFLPGVFAQDEITLSEKLTALAGLRYDYNSAHGHILSPRLSFKYMAGASNTIRLSGGNGYRVVNLFTEDHAALTGARKVVIAEKLRPEKSWNVNLNYQHFFELGEGFGTVDGSLFYTYFKNKIVGDYLTDPDKIIYANLNGYAISKGITVNSDFTFSFPLKMNMGVTFMNVYSRRESAAGELVKVPQQHAPAFSGTFAITYKFEKIHLSIDYTGRVTGPMYLPVVANDYRPDKSPWFTIQNVQLTKAFKRGWQVYGGIKNLFNFLPKDPLMRPFDPFDKYIYVNNPNGYTFDTAYNYAPVQGIRGFLGVRWIMN